MGDRGAMGFKPDHCAGSWRALDPGCWRGGGARGSADRGRCAGIGLRRDEGFLAWKGEDIQMGSLWGQ